MTDRIYELIRTLGKNPSDFAATIDISPALLSSIKSGRTKPTVYLIEKIKAVYPDINMNWLITGQGDMFISTTQESFVNQFDKGDGKVGLSEDCNVNEKKNDCEAPLTAAEPQVNIKVENHTVPDSSTVTPQSLSESNHNQSPADNPNNNVRQHDANNSWYVKTMVSPDTSKSITQIVVLYDDGTFETLKKSL